MWYSEALALTCCRPCGQFECVWHVALSWSRQHGISLYHNYTGQQSKKSPPSALVGLSPPPLTYPGPLSTHWSVYQPSCSTASVVWMDRENVVWFAGTFDSRPFGSLSCVNVRWAGLSLSRSHGSLGKECKAVNSAIKSSLDVLKTKKYIRTICGTSCTWLLKVRTTGCDQDRNMMSHDSEHRGKSSATHA